jgi:hypothetical protein
MFIALSGLALSVGAGENLLPNGNLDEGEGTPAHWQTIDGFTSFWEEDADPARGNVLRFDTDVLQSQAYDWWSKIAAGASPADAPKKLPTVEPKYDTLAAFDGAWFYSDPIPIEPGKQYWLTLDVRGAKIMTWLLGYAEKPETTFGKDALAFQGHRQEQAGTRDTGRGHKRLIQGYDWKGQLAAGGSSEWKTYSRREQPFSPTKNTPQIRYMRVLLLPFWPPGEYFVDNVTLTEYAPPTEQTLVLPFQGRSRGMIKSEGAALGLPIRKNSCPEGETQMRRVVAPLTAGMNHPTTLSSNKRSVL